MQRKRHTRKSSKRSMPTRSKRSRKNEPSLPPSGIVTEGGPLSYGSDFPLA